MSYKPFAERLKDLNRLTEFLGLKKLPSGSTLRKNADRIGNEWLNKILSSFAGDRHNIRVGVDSTGMQLQSSSNYYSEVLERHSKKEKRKSGRPAKRKIKKSQHFNVASDLDKQLILAVKSARGKRSDAKSMIPLLKKIKPISSQIGSVHADRGYDADYNFQYITEELHAEPLIKLKNKNTPINRTRGQYRKKAKQKQNHKKGRPPKNHRNKSAKPSFTSSKENSENTSEPSKPTRAKKRTTIQSTSLQHPQTHNIKTPQHTPKQPSHSFSSHKHTLTNHTTTLSTNLNFQQPLPHHKTHPTSFLKKNPPTTNHTTKKQHPV